MTQATFDKSRSPKKTDMKKIIFIICSALICFSLTAFGFMNWGEETKAPKPAPLEKGSAFFVNDLVGSVINPIEDDFVYNIDTRFIATITKEKLHAANSIREILPEKTTEPNVHYQDVKVSIFKQEKISQFGGNAMLSAAQLNFMQSIDYSQNIVVEANSEIPTGFNDQTQLNYISYHMTVVPEQEAEYMDGMDALIQYLKTESLAAKAGVEKNQLKPGRLWFTITKEGEVANVKLDSSSAYPALDEKMQELMENLPGKWEPAKNSAGEAVEQELVFFFGMQGC